MKREVRRPCRIKLLLSRARDQARRRTGWEPVGATPVGWIILRIGRAMDKDWARVLSWGNRCEATPQAATTSRAHQVP
jgi:hypothetical protein